MYRFKLTFLLPVITLLMGCSSNSGAWKNEQIDKGTREDFNKLNKEIFENLKANDLKKLEMYFCKELNHDHGTIRLVEIVSNHLNDEKFSLMDEYYTVNKYVDYDTILAKGKNINRYNLVYPGTSREMYIAFFIPKASKNKYLLTITYAKYDYGWKVSSLEIAPFTINGKTAPELYALAKENYSKNYLIDAVNNMTLAYTCLSPSNCWIYPDDQKINKFYNQMLDEANLKYKFPFIVTSLQTKPGIIRVYTKTISEGTFPLVYYLTKINLADTAAVKKENEQLRRVIGKIMPGIDLNKKYIFYSAFKEKPNVKGYVDHFDMTQKISSDNR